MLGDPSACHSSLQKRRVGSVNTMCIQVVIMYIQSPQYISTHMCYIYMLYTAVTCEVLHTSTKWLKRQKVWWQRRRRGVTMAAKRRKPEGQVMGERERERESVCVCVCSPVHVRHINNPILVCINPIELTCE